MENTMIDELRKPLHCWRDIIVDPQIEENAEDIWLAVKYDDHGDDLWLIGTKDGSFYRYGYIVNRTIDFVFDDAWKRKPVLFKKEDTRANVSNRMFFLFRERMEDFTYGCIGKSYTGTPKKAASSWYAQIIYDDFMSQVESAVKGDTMIHEHHLSYGYNKQSVRRFLEHNGIATEENLKKLENQPFDTRMNGLDGNAGKHRYECEIIVFDHIQYICINGREQDPKKAPVYYSHEDEWGVESGILNLNSYRPKKNFCANRGGI